MFVQQKKNLHTSESSRNATNVIEWYFFFVWANVCELCVNIWKKRKYLLCLYNNISWIHMYVIVTTCYFLSQLISKWILYQVILIRELSCLCHACTCLWECFLEWKSYFYYTENEFDSKEIRGKFLTSDTFH